LGTKHSEMWSNQMQRILQAIERLVAYLYSPCGVTSTGTVLCGIVCAHCSVPCVHIVVSHVLVQ